MTDKKREEEAPDENIYNKEEREDQLDDSEITPAEAGFMEGYEDTKWVECNACKKQIDLAHIVEREINGKMVSFCSLKCAETFEKRKAFD